MRCQSQRAEACRVGCAFERQRGRERDEERESERQSEKESKRKRERDRDLERKTGASEADPALASHAPAVVPARVTLSPTHPRSHSLSHCGA